MIMLLWLMTSASIAPAVGMNVISRGAPNFEFFGGLADSLAMRTAGTFRFWVESLGNTVVTARVALPPELQCVEGDTLVRVPPGMTRTWVVKMRPVGAGPFEIRGLARAEAPDSVVDELEWKIEVAVGDRPGMERTRTTRLERVVGHSRYRHMGRYLVPVGAPEPFSVYDIERQGLRAHPVNPTEITCRGIEKQADITLIAIVGSSGSVIAVQPKFWPDTDERELAARAALETVSRWRFEPTRMHGVAIDDLIEIKVRVNPGP